MTFDFTTPKAVRSSSTKWDGQHYLLGREAPGDMIPMWIAQMDFQPGPFLQTALDNLRNEGEYGYFTGLDRFCEKVSWWYDTRFGWTPDPAHMFATHGIGNAIGLTLQTFTKPGDGIIIFTPVYHEFTNKINRNKRKVVEAPLKIDADGFFEMDLAALEAKLDGSEKMVIFSAPHNPAGKVWTVDELKALAAFCEKHDLLLVSDEIHQDLVFTGYKHVPTALAAPECLNRLIVMSAASKTFDIAGLRTGYVIIPDDDLRATFGAFHHALDIQPNRAGMDLTIAAYSEDGAAWTDELVKTLEANNALLADGIAQIPGLSSMPMQSTYLTWIDFTGTGMSDAELKTRVHDEARILPSPGPAFGTGGSGHMRFNIGAPKTIVEEAVGRLQKAFADLQ